MSKKEVIKTILILVVICSLSACSASRVTPTEMDQDEALELSEGEPENVVQAYFAALNAKDWAKAASFLHSTLISAGSLEPTWKAEDATYSELEIQPYAEYIATAAVSHPELATDQGDVEGKCIRLNVSGKVYYPSGWGAGPSGSFGITLVLVKIDNTWKIIGQGSIGSDACITALKKIAD